MPTSLTSRMKGKTVNSGILRYYFMHEKCVNLHPPPPPPSSPSSPLTNTTYIHLLYRHAGERAILVQQCRTYGGSAIWARTDSSFETSHSLRRQGGWEREKKRKEEKGGGVKECCVLHGHVYTCMFVLIHIRSYTIRIMCDCALFRMLANKCLSAVRMLVCV